MRLRDIRTNLHRLSSRTLTRSPSSLHPDATAGQPTPLGQRFLRRRAYASYGSALTPTDLLGVCLVAPTSTGLLADVPRRAHTVRLLSWRARRTAPGLRHTPHVPQPCAPRWQPGPRFTRRVTCALTKGPSTFYYQPRRDLGGPRKPAAASPWDSSSSSNPHLDAGLRLSLPDSSPCGLAPHETRTVAWIPTPSASAPSTHHHLHARRTPTPVLRSHHPNPSLLPLCPSCIGLRVVKGSADQGRPPPLGRRRRRINSALYPEIRFPPPKIRNLSRQAHAGPVGRFAGEKKGMTPRGLGVRPLPCPLPTTPFNVHLVSLERAAMADDDALSTISLGESDASPGAADADAEAPVVGVDTTAVPTSVQDLIAEVINYQRTQFGLAFQVRWLFPEDAEGWLPLELIPEEKLADFRARNPDLNLEQTPTPATTAAAPAVTDDAPADDRFFVVERVHNVRVRRGGRQYLVSWRGFDRSHNSWEDTSRVPADAIAEYFMRKPHLAPNLHQRLNPPPEPTAHPLLPVGETPTDDFLPPLIPLARRLGEGPRCYRCQDHPSRGVRMTTGRIRDLYVAVNRATRAVTIGDLATVLDALERFDVRDVEIITGDGGLSSDISLTSFEFAPRLGTHTVDVRGVGRGFKVTHIPMGLRAEETEVVVYADDFLILHYDSPARGAGVITDAEETTDA